MHIPIKAAKAIADTYEWPVVVIFAADHDGNQHVTTYGANIMDSKNAAMAGNKLKKHLGWPDDLCKAKPLERICGNCTYYDLDYCLVEPVKIKRKKDDRACRHFVGTNWGDSNCEL